MSERASQQRVVLVTGATGVVGSALVPALLSDPAVQLVLLVRAGNAGELASRLTALLDFCNITCAERARVTAVAGDVELPRLGLAEDQFCDLGRIVTHIVHAAGSVKLNRSLEDARKTAGGALEQILNLARAAQSAGSFRKLTYFSTVGVAGCTAGMIREERLCSVRFRNTYEAAKAEAEQIAWRAADEGVPVTILRPSMVVGDSRSGKVIQFQVFYHLAEFLSGRYTGGVLPMFGAITLDLIPADAVAEMVRLSYDDDQTIGKVFHLSSGSEAARVDTLAARIRRKLDGGVPHVRVVPLFCFRAVLPVLQLFATRTGKRFLANLRFFIAYLHDRQIFDNSNTHAYLSCHGYKLPRLDEYLDNIMNYYAERTKSYAE